MALYDGFFDGSPVGTHEDGTTKYDREYSASDFYEYFGRFIGSGVCVHNNQDSMKIFLSGNQAVIMPGYLFINGEWLANKAGPDEADYQGYAVTVSATEKTAVLAHLSIGKAMIEILTQPTTQVYPSDSLVLGIVDVANNTVEDTRYNSEICGVIDAASSLTTKIDYAINYIDTEIDAKLAAAEAQINAKSDELESKIAEVRGIVNSISPPPIGAIKISAAASPGTGWLKCDGSFISKSTYPELVEILNKMHPFKTGFEPVTTTKEIGTSISNSVIDDTGKLWVYSHSAKKLYVVDIAGNFATKVFNIVSSDSDFNRFKTPTDAQPIALSVIPHKTGSSSVYRMFISQILLNTVADGDPDGESTKSGVPWQSAFAIFTADIQSFSNSNEENLTVIKAFPEIEEEHIDQTWSPNASYTHRQIYNKKPRFDYEIAIPYVISKLESGSEYYYCIFGGISRSDFKQYTNGELVRTENDFVDIGQFALKWENGDTQAKPIDLTTNTDYPSPYAYKNRLAFNSKNNDESIFLYDGKYTPYYDKLIVASKMNGTYSNTSINKQDNYTPYLQRFYLTTAQAPIGVAGNNLFLFGYDTTNINFIQTTGTDHGHIAISNSISLPSGSKTFIDAMAYLSDENLFAAFYGTGVLIFSGYKYVLTDSSSLSGAHYEFENCAFMDTKSIIGNITNYGNMVYDSEHQVLCVIGQTNDNKVNIAKLDCSDGLSFASNGAWLPTISEDGIPAYIKAKGDGR